jgi:hypothetical protein
MKTLHQPSQIAHATVDILLEVAAVGHAEPLGSGGHQLHKPGSAFRRDHARLPIRLVFDNGAHQRNGYSKVSRVGRDVVLSFNPCLRPTRLRPAG